MYERHNICLVRLKYFHFKADALLKTYPPFINFYEKTKEMILNCDKTKPRFHAFLKVMFFLFLTVSSKF
jgi:hypothetical protein